MSRGPSFRAPFGPRMITTALRLSVVVTLVVAGLFAASAPAGAAPPSTLAWSAPRQALLAETGRMTDVSCVSTTWCLAVDANGNYLTGAKGVWTQPRRAVTGASFTSVSCPSTSLCVATDTVGRATVYRNGSWGTPTTVFRDQFGTHSVGGVDCVDSSYCIAVDNAGNVSRWNGTAWGVPAPVLTVGSQYAKTSVSCASRTLCVALTSEGLAARFDGAKWRSIDSAFSFVSPANLSCARGTTACVVVADKTYRLSGTTWVVQSDNIPEYATSLQCASATRCVAAGLVTFNPVDWYGYTFTGTTWAATAIAAGYGENPAAVTVSCTTDLALCEGVGSTQEIWRPAGGKWSGTTLIDPINSTVASVSCTSATACVLASEHAVTRYNGSGWSAPNTLVQDSYPNVNFLTDVSCGSSTFCSVGANLVDDVGTNPQVFVTDGRTASLSTSSGAQNVSCPTSTFCAGISRLGGFVSGTDAAIYSGGTWGNRTPLDDGPVSSISCVSSTFCIAVGSDSDGAAWYRYNGSTWTLTRATIAGDDTAKVSCATTTFCVATSTDGFASVFNGRSWGAAKQITSSLGDLDCATTTLCVASANIGQVVEFNGTAWATPVTVTTDRVADVSCPTATACVAADVTGKVVFGKLPS